MARSILKHPKPTRLRGYRIRSQVEGQDWMKTDSGIIWCPQPHLPLEWEVMHPAINGRGLCLRSTSTRGCPRFSFTARHITGTEVPPGAMTRTPSFPTEDEKRLARKERDKGTKNILPRHGVLAWNPANVKPGKEPGGELSLSPVGECLSPHSSILCGRSKTGNAQVAPAPEKERPFLPRAGSTGASWLGR
jgi:hypothetical protein